MQEAVAGVIVLACKEALQHHGIFLSMEGLVNLQLSSKSVGVFEAFYNSVKVQEKCTAKRRKANTRQARLMLYSVILGENVE